MKIRVLATFFFLVCNSLVAQVNHLRAHPFSNKTVTLTSSWIKQREDLNTEYLKSLDPDRLLHNFRMNAGLHSSAQPLEGWEAPGIGLRGHFVGHYLSAVSSLVEKYSDPLLIRNLNYLVEELDKCQRALGHGYLSAFPENDFVILETQVEGVWAPYYTYHKIMQGLLDVSQRTGNRKTYDMVLKMASYVGDRMSKLDEEAIEKLLYTVGANPSNEPGAMNEVLYNLYLISGDPRHLALAKVFDRDWFVSPLSKNENILSGLHSNTHLVLVNGFAKRYSITGEFVYKNAVANFWNMLTTYHSYTNGSSSGPRPIAVTATSEKAEHWGVPGRLSNTLTTETGESCVSHNAQKLTSTLFTWNTDPKFADVYMNTLYNSVMALQNASTGTCVYHLPLGSPRKKIFLKENDFRCCNGSSIEAFSQLNSGIYYYNDSNLWVNLYIPSRVEWKGKGVVLQQAGNFPLESAVEFTVSAKSRAEFNLSLFIPSGTKNVTVYVNNKIQNINHMPNSYITLDRIWNNKDKVRLEFDFDFHIATMPDDKNVIAIYYGPILLAFESSEELILKGDSESILSNLSVVNSSLHTYMLDNNGKTYLLRPLFNIEDQSYGVYATLRNY